jgi:hypothetical protein
VSKLHLSAKNALYRTVRSVVTCIPCISEVVVSNLDQLTANQFWTFIVFITVIPLNVVRSNSPGRVTHFHYPSRLIRNYIINTFETALSDTPRTCERTTGAGPRRHLTLKAYKATETGSTQDSGRSRHVSSIRMLRSGSSHGARMVKQNNYSIQTHEYWTKWTHTNWSLISSTQQLKVIFITMVNRNVSTDLLLMARLHSV